MSRARKIAVGGCDERFAHLGHRFTGGGANTSEVADDRRHRAGRQCRRYIPGGGQPWTTLGGHANVDLSSGRTEFEVRGLVLAGGNTVGTPGTVNQVKGTLVCIIGTLVQAFDTPLVPLNARGDAEFSGAIGPIATTCTPTNVVFLVRIGADRWIANGAVRTSPGL